MRYESPIEMLLGAALEGAFRGQPVTIWPQYNAGPYRYDFCIIIPGRCRVMVECDGKHYHRTQVQRRRDLAKDRYAKLITGRPCLRYTGSEIWRDAPGIARQIRAAIAIPYTRHPQPLR